MSGEIVQRLRDPRMSRIGYLALAEEAADEIERLRRSDAVLREALARACEDGWADGAGAFDSYVRQAEAALTGSFATASDG